MAEEKELSTEPKIQNIGNITLDYTHYSGSDLYSDGPIEEELLDIVKNRSEAEYAKIIEESCSWPILYHLSPIRENIVSWLPIGSGDKVLEVGSGCGAITGALARGAAKVDCVDLSRTRSLVNAYRHEACDNVTIHVGNFKDIEPDLPNDYDWICLIGVFEYAQAYIGGETPYEDFLKILKKHLSSKGRLVIAIENKFGLKYWAGCKEDHLGTLFSSLEDYPDGGVARTFTYKGLREIAQTCGFDKNMCHFYYPYPDYKLMNTLFSDARLPKMGECKDNKRNFDRDRLQLFDEKQVFENILREEEFPLFSNSYLMLLGEAVDVIYARYSNDRAKARQIATYQIKLSDEVVKKENAVASGFIEKRPLTDESIAHLAKMQENYELLKNRYEGSELKICPCELSESGSIFFPIAEGHNLEELLDVCVVLHDVKRFHALFHEYIKRISYGEDQPVTNMDLIFSNIIVSGETWTAIDYEWVVKEQHTTAEIAFRALYCYLLEDERRESMEIDTLLSELNITDAQAEELRHAEAAFQKEVTDNHISLGEIRERIGQPVYSVSNLMNGDALLFGPKSKLQIYIDDGEGFREDNSYFPKKKDGKYRLEIMPGTVAIRIDPMMCSCIVLIKELKILEQGIMEEVDYLAMESDKIIVANGATIGQHMYAFGTDDPNITIPIPENRKLDRQTLEVELEIVTLPEKMASALPVYENKRNIISKILGRGL